jgi:hypothetical protein
VNAPKARLHIWRHEDSDPSPSLSLISNDPICTEINNSTQQMLDPDEIFALLVDASSGISSSMIELWNYISDRQFRRILLVQGLENSESDFDDIILIANRVMEKIATPYLVIHNENGAPVGLVDLEKTEVRSYEDDELKIMPCDDSLLDLIAEFRREFTEDFLLLGEDAFADGLYGLGIPIGSKRPFGIAELNSILAGLPTR